VASHAEPDRRRSAQPVSRKELAIDVGIALVAFALSLALLAGGSDSSRGLDPPGALLAALASLPLVARRRWPLGVLVLTTAASATLNGLDYRLGPPIGPTIALFFVAADERTRSRIRETGAVVVGLFAVHIGGAAIAHGGFPATPLLFGILVWGVAFVIGDQVRQRRQRTAELEERARRAEREAERERRLAAAEERTRIARDLHDSAGHAINVILVQAGAARLLHEQDPKSSREAIETIEEVARETLGEIDQLVRALRENGAAPEVEPPPGLAALETLAERYRTRVSR
jgi:signal transduction histidine kinase